MSSLIFRDNATKAEDLVWDTKDYTSNSNEPLFNLEGEATKNTTDNTQGPSSEEYKTLHIPEPKDIDDNLGIKYEDTEARKIRLEKTLRMEADLDSLSKATPHLHQFGTGALKTFINFCTFVHTTNKVVDGVTPALISLYRVLNFTALTMLRRVTKTQAQLTTAFMKTKYKENIYTLIPCAASKNYAPPTAACIEKTAVISKNN